MLKTILAPLEILDTFLERTLNNTFTISQVRQEAYNTSVPFIPLFMLMLWLLCEYILPVLNP